MGTRGYRGRLPGPVRRGYADAYAALEPPEPVRWPKIRPRTMGTALPGGGAVSSDDRGPDGGSAPEGPPAGRVLLRVGALGWRTRGRAGTQEGRAEAHWPHAYFATPDVTVQTAQAGHIRAPVSSSRPAHGHPRRHTAPEPAPSDRCGACGPRRAARLPAREALPYPHRRPAVPDAHVCGGPAGRRRTGTTVRELVRKGGGGHAQSGGVLRSAAAVAGHSEAVRRHFGGAPRVSSCGRMLPEGRSGMVCPETPRSAPGFATGGADRENRAACRHGGAVVRRCTGSRAQGG
jgi:hypothetical protein